MLIGTPMKIIHRILHLTINNRQNQTTVNKKFNITHRMKSLHQAGSEVIHILLILKTLVKIILTQAKILLKIDIKDKIFNQVRENYRILVLKLYNNQAMNLKQKRLLNFLILKNKINSWQKMKINIKKVMIFQIQ